MTVKIILFCTFIFVGLVNARTQNSDSGSELTSLTTKNFNFDPLVEVVELETNLTILPDPSVTTPEAVPLNGWVACVRFFLVTVGIFKLFFKKRGGDGGQSLNNVDNNTGTLENFDDKGILADLPGKTELTGVGSGNALNSDIIDNMELLLSSTESVASSSSDDSWASSIRAIREAVKCGVDGYLA